MSCLPRLRVLPCSACYSLSSSRNSAKKFLHSPQNHKCRLVRVAAAATGPTPTQDPDQEEGQDYTPCDFVIYCKDPVDTCHHEAGIWISAPIAKCFKMWNEWGNLLHFLDLVGDIHLAEHNKDTHALFFCYYRWALYPILEIAFILEKEEVVENKVIKFKSLWGMPLKGLVEFREQDGGTYVELRFEHLMPVLFKEYKIGVMAVESDMKKILSENMVVLKDILEGRLAIDDTDVTSAAGKSSS
ncbi:unnamed protein product [Ostreobium quekettii]|uniref:Coenzyme Q-binding protein COQ10 START domain-containing protein n=1 Tax=Ostreobium quekettii TaxID=121088 RepID=A0A8S1IPV6_9CHLO|nr:unnamed protein product [Ostreobium quekettii]